MLPALLLAALAALAAAQEPLGTELEMDDSCPVGDADCMLSLRQLRGEVRTALMPALEGADGKEGAALTPALEGADGKEGTALMPALEGADGKEAHSDECEKRIKEFEEEFKRFHVCKEKHHGREACEHFLDIKEEDLTQEDMKALVPLWDDEEEKEKPPVLWAGFWGKGNKCDHFNVLQDAIDGLHGFRLETTKVGKMLLKHKVITLENGGVCDWKKCGHLWWKGSKMMGATAVLAKKPKIYAIINKPEHNVIETTMFKYEVEEMKKQKEFRDRHDYEPEFILFNWNEHARCGEKGLHKLEEKARAVTKRFKCKNRVCKGNGEWDRKMFLAQGIDGANHSLLASPDP